jgi:phospholipid-translocating ATPase
MWMLTGDKMDTAMGVGRASSLLKDDTKVVSVVYDDLDLMRGFGLGDWKDREKDDQQVKKEDEKIVNERLCEVLKSLKISSEVGKKKKKAKAVVVDAEESKNALVIDGSCLGVILGNDRLIELLLRITDVCRSVICCRISPIQKVS